MGTAFFGAEARAYRQKAPPWQAPGRRRGNGAFSGKVEAGFPRKMRPKVNFFVQGYSSLYKPLEPLKISWMARGDVEKGRLSGRAASRSLAPLRRILPFLKPYRGRIAIAGLALIASSTATLVLPALARGLIDHNLSSSQARNGDPAAVR